jgi:hypothetical protein
LLLRRHREIASLISRQFTTVSPCGYELVTNRLEKQSRTTESVSNERPQRLR